MPETILSQLVGDGKKFKTVEDLAKGKMESDVFINSLQDENKSLRDVAVELGTKHDKLESDIAYLKSLSGKDGQPPAPSIKTPDTKPEPGLTAEAVSKLIDERDRKAREDANEASVDAVLLKQFGAEAKNEVAKAAKALGLTPDELTKQARLNPTAFYKLVGINPSQTSGSLSGLQSGSRSQGTPSSDSAIRGSKWWEAERKRVGAYKFAIDKNLTLQMHKDMRELGDAWDAN